MKDMVLNNFGCVEVSAIEMYSDIIRLGQGLIQQKNEPGGFFKINPIAVATSAVNEKERQIDHLRAEIDELKRS